MAYDNRPNLSCRQFDQRGTDYLYLGGHNCVCGTGGTISSNSGYGISGVTILSTGKQLHSLQIGCNTIASGASTAIGAAVHACGVATVSIGCGSCTRGNGSVALGSESKIFCNCGIAIGYNNVICAINSSIFGGFGNTICSGNTNTVLLGLSNQTIGGTNYAGHVIVPNLTLLNIPAGTGNYLCVDNSTNKVGRIRGLSGVTSLGTGNGVLCAGYSNNTIQLKSLCGGSNITLTCSGNYVTISSTGGNSVTVTSNDVIYTCKNIPSGLTTATNNVLFGCDAGKSITTSSNNIAIGCKSLCLTNNTGSQNIGIGSRAMGCCIVFGFYNIGIGFESLAKTTSGSWNIGLGFQSLVSNQNGTDNIALGQCGAYSNTNGNCNIAIGIKALNSNTVGNCNIAIGKCAGFFETGSNKLHISNCANKSLIYGEFDNDKLCIRGKTYISGLTNTSTSNVIYYNSSTKELSYGAAPSGSGGVTGATNLGTGNGTIFTTLNNNCIQLKTLSGGTNITLTCNGNYVGINSTGGVSCRENITKLINQASHGFSVGNVIGWSGGTYNKAIANGNYDGEVIGIVSKCYNTNCFDLTQSGYVTGLTSLSTNTTYFLSPTTAGLLTSTEPTVAGQVSKSVLIADSTTSGWVLPYAGYIITSGTSTTEIVYDSNAWIYFGDKDTNGTWRMGVSGSSFVHQYRTGGVYVNKHIINP